MEGNGSADQLAGMKIRDERWKAKVYHKLRWYYVHCFQGKKRYLGLYKSYRHFWFAKGKNSISNNENSLQYMTKIVNPTAGIGDQLASWITGLYYAQKFHLTYAYSPLFPKEWDEFLGFWENEQTTEELLKRYGYRRVWLPYFEEQNKAESQMIQGIIESYKGQKVIFFIEISQVYGAQFGAMTDIRKKFNMAPVRQQDKLIYQADVVNVAVHVRRGDIVEGYANDDPQMAMRWLDNDYYVNVLKQVTELLQHTRYKIYIFSQGIPADFEEFQQFGEVEYCLDMPAIESFLHLVRADVLITSKSSFSYKPALLSDGIRICPRNFWHGYPDNSKWILADDYGIIEREELRKLKENEFKN